MLVIHASDCDWQMETTTPGRIPGALGFMCLSLLNSIQESCLIDGKHPEYQDLLGYLRQLVHKKVGHICVIHV